MTWRERKNVTEWHTGRKEVVGGREEGGSAGLSSSERVEGKRHQKMECMSDDRVKATQTNRFTDSNR